jgi:MFS family permease
MAVEHSPKSRRGFSASWPQAGVPAGSLLSTGVFALFALLPREQFLAWGWRCPFLLGIVLVAVGLFIRLRVMETPHFAQVREKREVARVPLFEVLRAHPRGVLLAMGARFAENVSYYLFTVFVLTYATANLGMDKGVALTALLVASAAEFVTIPLFGALSDRWGRRPVYLGGAAFLALFAFPFFWLLDTRSAWGVGLALVIGLAVAHAAMYGPQAAFFSELFGTRVRYSGASLGYQLASPFAGGLAPLIAAALLQSTGGAPWPVALYLAASALLTLLCVILAAETSSSELG